MFNILQELYFIKRVFLQNMHFFTNNIDLFYKNIAKIQERKRLTNLSRKCIVFRMIVENEKIKVKELEKEFSFIKECL